MKKVVIGVLIVVSLASVTVLGAQRILEQKRISDEVARLRDSLYRARILANRCQQSLAANTDALQRFDARLDSMRASVDSFEALDRRGVPVAQYDDYLATLEMYNDSAGTWEARERQLRLQDASCRGVIDGHNAVRDSLEHFLADMSSSD